MCEAPKRIWAASSDDAGGAWVPWQIDAPEYTRADLINMDVLRRVEAALMRNHTWHLSQTEPIDMGGVEIVPAEAYSESAMCNATEAALTDLRAMMEKLK